MPGSTGMLRSSSTTASRPPADEPTPTMGKTELTYSFSALVGEVATKLVFFWALEGLVDFFRVAIDRQDSMPMRAKRPPSCLDPGRDAIRGASNRGHRRVGRRRRSADRAGPETAPRFARPDLRGPSHPRRLAEPPAIDPAP